MRTGPGYDPQDVIDRCEPCGFPIFAGYDYVPHSDGGLTHPGSCAAEHVDVAARITAQRNARPDPAAVLDVEFDGDTTTSAQHDYDAAARANDARDAAA